jgi:hypothetical protein
VARHGENGGPQQTCQPQAREDLGVNDALLRKLEAEKERDLPVGARFVAYALELAGARYEWGGENLLGADCSGTVCLPLLRMGYQVRVTAQRLFDRYFPLGIRTIEPANWTSQIMAVFYGADEQHIIHVTPIVGPDVVLNAHQSKNIVEIRAAATVRSWYPRSWVRVADMRALQAANEVHGLDAELRG